MQVIVCLISNIRNMSIRHPNTKCIQCGKPIYKRPWEIKTGWINCSRECAAVSKTRFKQLKECIVCKEPYYPTHSRRVVCGKGCANKLRLGKKYTKAFTGNMAERKINHLRKYFEFDSCMIEGCDYNKCYEVHRHIPGKDGGEYVIGNMFAICPNHHAEVTRGIITLSKISDCVLRIV